MDTADIYELASGVERLSSTVHGIFQHKNWGDAKLSGSSSTRETAPQCMVKLWIVLACSTEDCKSYRDL